MLMPKTRQKWTGTRTREAQVEGGIEGANIHAQLQCIGGCHAPQLAMEQRRLYLAPLLTGMASMAGSVSGARLMHVVQASLSHGGV